MTISQSSNQYHFITRWRVQGTVDEVLDIMNDATQLPSWWPAVYLAANRLKAGDENHVGEEIDLYTKGFLPYTLRWTFRISEVEPRKRIKLESRGDFVGFGIWTFQQDDDYVDITYEWKIEAQKPLLRTFSALLKPFFSANHHWAMNTGLVSLERELARRRAKTPAERALIPPPPAPTPTSPIPYAVGGLIALWLVVRVFRALFGGK